MTPKNATAQEKAVEALIAASLRAPDKETEVTKEEICRYVEQRVTLSSEDKAALEKSKPGAMQAIKSILLGEAYARDSDPLTSHEAAEVMEGDKANRLEKIALNAIASAPQGLTNHDLVAITGYDWNSITPRIRPLVNKGLVVDSGETRLGPKGRQCIVWKTP